MNWNTTAVFVTNEKVRPPILSLEYFKAPVMYGVYLAMVTEGTEHLEQLLRIHILPVLLAYILSGGEGSLHNEA